jgi:hypothetical protein
MMKLIDFIIVEPKDAEDKNSGYKFPFNACDILSSENLTIVDKFFEEELQICNGKKSSCGDDENDFDNENDEFKTKILIESNIKEKFEKGNHEEIGEESQKKEESNQNKNPNEPNFTHMEADNNMKISAERLMVFDEISQEEKKEDNKEVTNLDDTKERTHEFVSINVTQEQEQIPPNENHKTEVHNTIGEDNYFSNDRKKLQSEKKQESQFVVIDHFLKFVETDQPLNYVLSGYFAKIFLNILNLKTNSFLKYIFTTRREFLSNLVRHSHMKSISDIIIMILNTNLAEIEEEDVKKELFSKILDSYSCQNKEVNTFH